VKEIVRIPLRFELSQAAEVWSTFAFATALERHLNWKYSIIGYTFASYVAISRLPANRHWLSDAVFGGGSPIGPDAVRGWVEMATAFVRTLPPKTKARGRPTEQKRQ
jgi:hypothetical protein